MAKTTKKQTRDSHLTDLEKLGGVILLLIYLALIPLCGAAILNWAGGLLGLSIGPALRQTIWFYLLFAAVTLVFHRFLFACAGTFTGSAARSFQTLGTALIFFYGLNEILFRVTHLLWGHTVNLNDTALISLDLLNAAPAATVLALVVLAPFVEEVLLRGFLFGWLRQHSRSAAYLVTCVLFALLHTWASAEKPYLKEKSSATVYFQTDKHSNIRDLIRRCITRTSQVAMAEPAPPWPQGWGWRFQESRKGRLLL